MADKEQSRLHIDTTANGLRIIRFNAPARRNAINRATYVALARALDEASADDSVSVIALTGTGEYFSSGNDMSNAAAAANDLDAYFDDSIVNVRRLVHSFVRCPKLLVAVVNGPAIGIAATILPLCDVVYAVDTAYIYTPFTALGLSAEGGSSYTFPRILGRAKASEMLLLNHRLSAAEALRLGLVAEVYAAGELESRLWPRVREWTELAQQSLRNTKALMRQFDEQALLGAVEQEMAVLRARLSSDEAMEAVMKFMSRPKKSKL